jgi:hypothetical protein
MKTGKSRHSPWWADRRAGGGAKHRGHVSPTPIYHSEDTHALSSLAFWVFDQSRTKKPQVNILRREPKMRRPDIRLYGYTQRRSTPLLLLFWANQDNKTSTNSWQRETRVLARKARVYGHQCVVMHVIVVQPRLTICMCSVTGVGWVVSPSNFEGNEYSVGSIF